MTDKPQAKRLADYQAPSHAVSDLALTLSLVRETP